MSDFKTMERSVQRFSFFFSLPTERRATSRRFNIPRHVAGADAAVIFGYCKQGFLSCVRHFLFLSLDAAAAAEGRTDRTTEPEPGSCRRAERWVASERGGDTDPRKETGLRNDDGDGGGRKTEMMPPADLGGDFRRYTFRQRGGVAGDLNPSRKNIARSSVVLSPSPSPSFSSSPFL